MWMIDKLVNLVSGLGTAKDKSTANAYALTLLNQPTLEAMYRGNWLARKIVDIVPDDMTREWRTWQADEAQVEAIEEVEKRLGLQSKVTLALQWARLYGGAAIYIGTKDVDTSQELLPERISKDGIKFLHVLSRHELNPGDIENDLMSPFFGQPKFYELANGLGGQFKIHRTRIVPFFAMEIPGARQTNEQWSDPVLQVVNDAVMNATSSEQHIASLLPEMKTDVISVPGLSEILSTPDGTSRLTNRFALAATLKSLHNVLLLEGGPESAAEKWETRQLNFAGLPDLAKLYLQIAAGAADIPVTRLLGQSPAGMNSTGESDVRNYYDNLSSRQKNELSQTLYHLDEMVIRCALGSRPAEVYYVWAPLWQMSEKEKAEVAKSKAETSKIYDGMGIFAPEALAEAVTNQLIEDGTYPGLQKAIDDAPEVDFSEPEPLPVAPGANPSGRPPLATDAAPRTLYVSRKVLNSAEIIRWAKAQGFETTLEASDLHVTVAYSRTPLDWMQIPQNWSEDKDGRLTIHAGGPRVVEPLGDKGAIVLFFKSADLAWRHETIKGAGASWDHEGYQPHITLTYNSEGVDVSKVVPYSGPIVLGPEIFEEVNENWAEENGDGK